MLYMHFNCLCSIVRLHTYAQCTKPLRIIKLHIYANNDIFDMHAYKKNVFFTDLKIRSVGPLGT